MATYRTHSTPPSPSRSSPAPSPPSQIYSSPPASALDEPSYLSSPHAPSSSIHADEDSLAAASPAAVESRALDFLADEEDDGISKFSTSDIPRKVGGGSTEEDSQGMENAVGFLRACVEEAEGTDWMFTTPSVFSPPAPLDPRNQVGGNGGEGKGWLEDAFNIESYGSEEGEEYPAFFGSEEGLEGMDLGGEERGEAGMPFLREGEEGFEGAGFGEGRRGLVSRVGEMVV